MTITSLLKFPVVAMLGLLAASAGAAERASLPRPFTSQDIGQSGVPGSATFSQDVFTLRGTGDTWGTQDTFQFVSAPWRFSGGQVVAKVMSLENTHDHAKAGLMFRESLDANSRHAQICVTAVDGVQFLTRLETNGVTRAEQTGLHKKQFPIWIKLVREGNKFSGYESVNGTNWNLVGATNIVMATPAYVGLTASSHQKTNTATAWFAEVKVSPVAGPAATP